MNETMCNEILGNFAKKEDQLMVVAFGNREKRRLNSVMDALQFDYPYYPKISEEEATSVKRKRIVSIMKRQVVRSVKEQKKTEMATKQKIIKEAKKGSPHTRGQNPLPKEAKNDEA